MRDRSAKLIFLFVLFALALNYPLLSLFDREGWIGHFPRLYFYFFALWAVMIVAVGLLIGRRRPSR